MEINVKIKWDTPDDKDWLNPDNIATALSAYCKNTNFEVSEITPSIKHFRDGVEYTLRDIDRGTVEGELLFAALTILTVETRPTKTPDEVMRELHMLSHEIKKWSIEK